MRKCRIIDRLALTKHGVIRLVNDEQEMGKAPPEHCTAKFAPNAVITPSSRRAGAGTANLADTASAT